MTSSGFESTRTSILLAVALMALLSPIAGAKIPQADPDFSEAAITRGKAVFTAVCQNCHSLKYAGFAARMNAETATRAFGKVPPDLSLIAKARGKGRAGAGYIYTLLVGFNETPEKNSIFPNIAMPSVLSPADPQSGRKARDVSAFLLHTAEPSAGERRNLGRYVLGYMVVLTTLLFLLNRKTWRRIRKIPLHHQ